MATAPKAAARLPAIHEADGPAPHSRAQAETSQFTSPSQVEQLFASLRVPSADPGEKERGRVFEKSSAARQDCDGARDQFLLESQQVQKELDEDETLPKSTSGGNVELRERDSALSVRTQASPSSRDLQAIHSEVFKHDPTVVQRRTSSESISPSLGSRSSYRVRDSGYVSGTIHGQNILESRSHQEERQPAGQSTNNDSLPALLTASSQLHSLRSKSATSSPAPHSISQIAAPLYDATSVSSSPTLSYPSPVPLTTPGLESLQASGPREHVWDWNIVRPDPDALVEDGTFDQRYLRVDNCQFITPNQQHASVDSASTADERLAATSCPLGEARTSTPSFSPLLAYNVTPAVPPDPPESSQLGSHGHSDENRIAFNPLHVEKLGYRCYMDRTAEMPDDVVQEWDETVKPRLDRDLQELMRAIDARRELILSKVQLCMAGDKRGNSLIAKPTIIITCGSQLCKRKIAKNLTRLKLHYLDDFGSPIKVRYERSPVYWAASPNTNTVPSPGLSGLKAIAIRYPTDSQTSCGLDLDISVIANGGVSHNQATLGGVLCIGDTLYGMTAAHSVFAVPNDRSGGKESETPSLRSGKAVGCKTLLNSELHRKIVYSYLGRVGKLDGVVESNSPTASDWAVFPIPGCFALPNMNRHKKRLTSIASKSELKAGRIQIMHGVDSQYSGHLTQGDVSLGTRQRTLNVREILLDSSLPRGASGSWVVRDHAVLGYVVATSGKGRSCFMISMERALRDMTAIFGPNIALSWEPHWSTQKRSTGIVTDTPLTSYDLYASHVKIVQDPSEEDLSAKVAKQTFHATTLTDDRDSQSSQEPSTSDWDRWIDDSPDCTFISTEKPEVSKYRALDYVLESRNVAAGTPRSYQKMRPFWKNVVNLCI